VYDGETVIEGLEVNGLATVWSDQILMDLSSEGEARKVPSGDQSTSLIPSV
jgi:hypothetical protein